MATKPKRGRPKGSVKKKDETTSISVSSEAPINLPVINYRAPKGQMKKTTDSKKLFLEFAYATRVNLTASCAAIGIERKTYYLWMAKDDDFARCINDAREAIKDFVEDKLYQMIGQGNPQLLQYYLKSKMKDRGYADNDTNVYQVGNIEEVVFITKKKDDEQLSISEATE